MAEFTWLASYPKSGNTWFRMIVANLHAEGDRPVDINNLPERGGMASARQPFDNLLMVESGLLTHEECDRMRPMLYRTMARQDEPDTAGPSQGLADEDRLDHPTRLVKVHDAWTYTDCGEPLLGGAGAAINSILIVRDPRDVAPSLANHNGTSIDEAIAFMGPGGKPFCGTRKAQPNQLRQLLLGWSGHAASWLDQDEIPLHLVRYEEMVDDPVETVLGALHFARFDIARPAVARAVDLASFERLAEQERAASFCEAPVGRTFFRKGRCGGWRDELTSEQVARIESDHARMMEQLGYSSSMADPQAIAGGAPE